VRKFVVAAVVAPVLVAGGLVTAAMVSHEDPQAGACTPTGTSVSVSGVPPLPVAGWSGDQLVNAALIMEAGEALGVSARGQVIGVMTAMGESSLTVIDRGDAVGPDSRGLFQQRANGAWGSYEDRMDPTISATNFFKALLEVDDWETLSPTLAAHRTQRNADPYHYARWWDDALEVAAALSGATVTGLAPGTGSTACTGASPVLRTVTGDWTSPTDGPLTSGFGQRNNPTGGGVRLHAGLDLAPGCDAPILAASSGVVVRAGESSGYGNLVVIDHGNGLATAYAHLSAIWIGGGSVSQGQGIGAVGCTGSCTGPHLHFEVRVNGSPVDPMGYL
jgi:peptidase M23-like protein